MTNDEARMSNRNRTGVSALHPFVIRASSLFRHSDFDIRHSPRTLAMSYRHNPLGRLGTALLLAGVVFSSGCCFDSFCGRGGRAAGDGPSYDRPFPLGQVTDSFWETQQTNAEAADFTFFDHEFKGNTAELAPGAKKHLMQVALRLEHVPFPVVVEESPHNGRPQLDKARQKTIVEQLARLGVPEAEKRVVIAPAFAEGFTAVEGEAAYYHTLNNGQFFQNFPGTRATFR
jgi:hypothetical protein